VLPTGRLRTSAYGPSTGRGVVPVAAVRHCHGRWHFQTQAAATDKEGQPVPVDRRAASKNVQW